MKIRFNPVAKCSGIFYFFISLLDMILMATYEKTIKKVKEQNMPAPSPILNVSSAIEKLLIGINSMRNSTIPVILFCIIPLIFS